MDGIGQITTDTLGNGIVTERWLTPAGGLPSKIISGPGAGSSTVQNQTYSYDVLGNVTQRQDSNGQGLTESFPDYDGDNRLQESTLLNSSTNTTTTNLSVSYNPDGSISQKTEAGGTDTPVGYSVHWTSYNYPQSISATLSSGNESATFDYGPDRQRWRMVYTEGSGSETTEYIGGLMEKVTSSTGSSDYRYYVYGGNGLAAVVDIAGSTVTPHYVLEDQEGSISSLLNSTGSIAAEESFTAFGNRREASTWSGPPSLPEEAAMDSITRQGFTGQTVLAQMGLNHMNGRVEDAVTGTFLSPDPYVTDPGNTQDYYRYAYVYNDPLTYTDPSGFDAQSKCNDDRGCASGGDGSGSTSGGGDNGGGSQSPHMVAPLNPVTVQGLRCDWCASPNVLTLVYQYSGSASYGASHFGSSPGKTSSQQQSNPVSPTVLPTVTVTATSPLQQVTTTAQYEYPLSEAPLGDGLLDLVRQILGELSRPPHEVLSPQDLKNAGINFQTGHYINRVGPENVGPVEDTAEGIVNSPDFVPGTSACFTCNGVNYEMRTYVLPDGTINVGTIFPIE